MGKTGKSPAASGKSPGGVDKNLPAGAQGNATPAKKWRKQGEQVSPTKRTESLPVNTLFVTTTMPGDMVGLMEKANGQPPFVFPSMGYLNDNPEFRCRTLCINQIHARVHPTDPLVYKEVATGSKESQRMRTYPVFVYIVPENMVKYNNPKNRAKWAQGLVEFFNHPKQMSLYTYKSHTMFAGDLSPQVESNAPPLSDFLTIDDTMTVLREVNSPTETPCSIADVIAEPEAMKLYYGPETLEIANRMFAGHRNQAPANEGGGEALEDLPPFVLE